jgi:hypothetical protein
VSVPAFPKRTLQVEEGEAVGTLSVAADVPLFVRTTYSRRALASIRLTARRLWCA